MTWFEDKYGALKVGARIRLLSDESEWLLTPNGWEPVVAVRPRRRCMWPRCPKTNFWDPDIDMCKAHSLVIAQRTVAIDEERAAKEAARKDAATQKYIDDVKLNEERKIDGLDPLPGTNETPQVVYYVQVGEHIKIGTTCNLRRRMAAYPPGSTLLTFEYGGKALERERHRQFHAILALGREWFLDRPELRAHIETLTITDPDMQKWKGYQHKMRSGPSKMPATLRVSAQSRWIA